MTDNLYSLSIEKYRGIRNLSISDFSQMNIFVGSNNSGKTSILEAIKLLSAPYNIGNLVAVSMYRSQSRDDLKRANVVEYCSTIFTKSLDSDTNDKHYEIEISGTLGQRVIKYSVSGSIEEKMDIVGKIKRVFELSFRFQDGDKKPDFQTAEIINNKEGAYGNYQRPLYEALFIHANVSFYQSCVHLLSEYIIHDSKEELIKILQSFDANITDISIIGEDVYLHNNVSDTLPLFSYGAGLQKAVLLSAAVANCKGGILLIDEIDNAINISAFNEVFPWFIKACERNSIQTFITTHSAEAIDSILESCKNSSEDTLRIITIRRNSDYSKTFAKVRSGHKAYSDREKFEMELRV